MSKNVIYNSLISTRIHQLLITSLDTTYLENLLFIAVIAK